MMANNKTDIDSDAYGCGTDLYDPQAVVDLFGRATEANLHTPLRQGSTIDLPDQGRLLMTGDLHDNGLNLQRILKLAELDHDPSNHLILHEVIHGEHRVNGQDTSIRMLARVASLKLQFPEQVHLLQANHELAQLGGNGILKEGVNMVDAFNAGVDFLYDDDAEDVRDAMDQFIRSLLLAVRCPKGVFCCHSLPTPLVIDNFDTMVILRVPTEGDLGFGGDAYNMVWGRNHTKALSEYLADAWQTRLFVMGHQPVDAGYQVEGQRMLVLSSDDDRGVGLPIDLSTEYDMEKLVGQIVPLTSVDL